MNLTTEHIEGPLKRLYATDVSRFDKTFLVNSVRVRMKSTGCESAGEYYSLLELDHNEGDTLRELLQNSYSEFFRNPLTFAVLESIVLPQLVSRKNKTRQKEIRIWSAACANGQEAYSLAMLMEKLKNQSIEKIVYRIFASDHNEHLVRNAVKGQYMVKAMNNVSLMHANQWFSKEGDTYKIKPELKANIHFSVFDLLNEELNNPPDCIFGGFDLIVCANILFYYNENLRKIILDKLTGSLAKGGLIMTGEAERKILKDNYFWEVLPESAIFKR